MEREKEELASFLFHAFGDCEKLLRDFHTKYVESSNNPDVPFREYTDAKEAYLVACGWFVADLLDGADITRGELLHG